MSRPEASDLASIVEEFHKVLEEVVRIYLEKTADDEGDKSTMISR